MPTERDIVVEARKILALDTPAPWLRISPDLLRALADEVERLRKQTVTMAQDARYDAQAAADEAYWRDKQGDEYGSY